MTLTGALEAAVAKKTKVTDKVTEAAFKTFNKGDMVAFSWSPQIDRVISNYGPQQSEVRCPNHTKYGIPEYSFEPNQYIVLWGSDEHKNHLERVAKARAARGEPTINLDRFNAVKSVKSGKHNETTPKDRADRQPGLTHWYKTETDTGD